MESKDKKLFLILLLIILLFGVFFVVFTVYNHRDDRIETGDNQEPTIYKIEDYIKIEPVLYEDYSDIYSKVEINKIKFNNLDDELINDYLVSQTELLKIIDDIYSNISDATDEQYVPISEIKTKIEAVINKDILTVVYQLSLNIDPNYYSSTDNYYLVLNIDLKNNKILTNEDLLDKYDIEKQLIVDKLYEKNIMITDDTKVLDKETGAILDKDAVNNNMKKYKEIITDSFGEIIDIYIVDNETYLIYRPIDIKRLCFNIATGGIFPYIKEKL